MITVWGSETFEEAYLKGERVEEAAVAHRAIHELARREDLRNELRSRTATLSLWDAAAVAGLGALGILPIDRVPKQVVPVLKQLVHDDVAHAIARGPDLRSGLQALLAHGSREVLGGIMDGAPHVLEGSFDSAGHVVHGLYKAVSRASAGEVPFDLVQLGTFFDLDVIDLVGVGAVRLLTDLYLLRFRKFERNSRAYHEAKALSYAITGALSVPMGNPYTAAMALSAWHFGSALWVSRTLTSDLVSLAEQAQRDAELAIDSYHVAVRESRSVDELCAIALRAAAPEGRNPDSEYEILDAFAVRSRRGF